MSTNSDGYVEVLDETVRPLPPRIKKEPRFPFQNSATRPRQLLEQAYQRAAFESFKNKAMKERSKSSGFYGSSSGSDSCSHTSEPRSAHQAQSASPAPNTGTARLEPVSNMSANMTARSRRPSDAASVSSAVTTATTSVLSTADKYLLKLEARLARENPELPTSQLQLLLIQRARTAYDRAKARETAGVEQARKLAEVNNPKEQPIPQTDTSTEKQIPIIDNHIATKSEVASTSSRVDKGKQAVRPQTGANSSPIVGADNTKRSDDYWAKRLPPAEKDVTETWGFTPAEDAEVDDWALPALKAAQEPPLLPPPVSTTRHVESDADDADDEEAIVFPVKKVKLRNRAKQHWSQFVDTATAADASISNPDGHPTEEQVEDLPADPSQPNFDEAPPPQLWSPSDDESSQEAYESSGDEDPTTRNITNVERRKFADNTHKNTFVLRYLCNFEDCGFSSVKVKEIMNHKIDKHHVCVKCDMEFNNADALLLHKQASATHVVCWVCGADFATTPARNRHHDSHHPDDKEIQCPGCGEIHVNQTSFIIHLEQKLCPSITSEQWDKARKMVSKMKEFAMIEHAEIEKHRQAQHADFESQKNGGNVNKEEDDLGPPGLDLCTAQLVTQLPGLAKPDQKPTASAIGATTGFVQKLQTMSVSDGMDSALLGPREQRLLQLYRRMARPASLQPPQLPEDKEGNVLYQGVPGHKLYNPGYFWNGIIQSHICPQAFCSKRFKTTDALDAHLRSPAHGNNDLRCPECNNRFGSAGALMGHLEAPSTNCYIRNSDIYKEALEVASGAFLSTTVGLDGKMKVVAQEPTW